MAIKINSRAGSISNPFDTARGEVWTVSGNNVRLSSARQGVPDRLWRASGNVARLTTTVTENDPVWENDGDNVRLK